MDASCLSVPIVILFVVVLYYRPLSLCLLVLHSRQVTLETYGEWSSSKTLTVAFLLCTVSHENVLLFSTVNGVS